MTKHNNKLQTVWDIPVRLIHWSMVVLLIILWWTAENDEMDIHRYAGYTMIGLLVFRIYWGFTGSNTARFSQFVKGPSTTWHYAKNMFNRQQTARLGHNPLGAYSAILLFILLFAQLVTGLFAIDVDGWEAGPLNHYVSFDLGRLSATWHEYLFNIILAWVVVHVVAIAYYYFAQKQNLLKPMFNGKTQNAQAGEFIAANLKHYLIGLALVFVVLWLLLA
jgi:cytochrome b